MAYQRQLRDTDIQKIESDHRIANSLQFLTAILRHEIRQIADIRSAKEALESAACRLAATARLHRHLSRMEMTGVIRFSEMFEDFCGDMSESIDVQFLCMVDGVIINANVAGQLYIVVNEFAMNAKKHGGLVGKPVVVTIAASRGPDQRLRLLLSDNGCGYPKDFSIDNNSGLGMLIFKSAVEKLHGTVEIIDHDSAAILICLPDA